MDKVVFAGKLKSSNRNQAEIIQACVDEESIFSSDLISSVLPEIVLTLKGM